MLDSLLRMGLHRFIGVLNTCVIGPKQDMALQHIVILTLKIELILFLRFPHVAAILLIRTVEKEWQSFYTLKTALIMVAQILVVPVI